MMTLPRMTWMRWGIEVKDENIEEGKRGGGGRRRGQLESRRERENTAGEQIIINRIISAKNARYY